MYTCMYIYIYIYMCLYIHVMNVVCVCVFVKCVIGLSLCRMLLLYVLCVWLFCRVCCKPNFFGGAQTMEAQTVVMKMMV